MDFIKNSANFELYFIYFYEKYAWFTLDGCMRVLTKLRFLYNRLALITYYLLDIDLN